MVLKTRTVSVFAFALLLLAAGCRQPPGGTQRIDPSAEMAKINELRDQFAAAFNSGDAGAVSAFYTEDAVLMPANQPLVEGKEAIQKWYQTTFQEATSKIRISPRDTQLLGEWAFEHGTAEVTVIPKGAKTAMESSGKYLVILRRQGDGSWKVHRDMENSNAPPPGAAAPKK